MTSSCSRDTSQLLSSLRALHALLARRAMAAPSWCVVRGGAWRNDIFGQPTALTIRRPKTVPGYGCLKRYTGVGQIVGGVHNQRLGSITKAGSSMARWLLAQVTIKVLRRDARLREWFQRLKRRRGASIARVAVMRKLATVIWHMLSKGKTYAECRAAAAA